MPRLDEAGISYYNPQVDEWHPSLIALETEAKESAAVLLFILDPQTRGLVSAIEVLD
jgi:hypothetical protein